MKSYRRLVLVAAMTISAFPVIALGKDLQFKRVSFDDFFGGQIAATPLSMEIPAEFSRAKEMHAPLTYSYWMRPADVAASVKSQNLPKTNGYIYGKVSMGVGYDAGASKFTEEDDLDRQLAQQGFEIVEKKRVEVKGFPVLSHILRAKNGAVVCQMYVGLQIATNTVYISYRPPNNDVAVAKAVWGRVVASLAAGGNG